MAVDEHDAAFTIDADNRVRRGIHKGLELGATGAQSPLCLFPFDNFRGQGMIHFGQLGGPFLNTSLEILFGFAQFFLDLFRLADVADDGQQAFFSANLY